MKLVGFREINVTQEYHNIKLHVGFVRGRRSQYERNGTSAPLVYGLSGRVPPGRHAPSDKC